MLAASEADRDSLPARLADRTVCIGPAAPSDSYLKVETHRPGGAGHELRTRSIRAMGFCRSAPRSRALCEQHGIIFIGPTAAQIEAVGDKLRARAAAEAAKVPVVPGGAVDSPSERAGAGACASARRCWSRRWAAAVGAA